MIKEMGVIVLEQEINISGGTFHGSVIGVNHGCINHSTERLKEIEPHLSKLLEQLEQEQLTQYHAKKVIKSLDEFERVEETQKEAFIDKLVENAGKLAIVAEASIQLYPIAEKAFGYINGLVG